MKLKYFIYLYLIHNTANADIHSIQVNTIKESYSENVKVAGEYLVGVQLDANDDSKDLHVFLPNNTKGNLCVALSSIDGKYKAKLEHSIETPMSGLTKVNFNSKHKEKFNAYSNHELAISAKLMPSCDDFKSGKMLISSWGHVMTKKLVLLIRSSARKDIAYIPSKNNYTIKAKCKKFRKTNSVSYDKYCELNGVNINSAFEIEIIRKNLQSIAPEKISFY